MNPVIYLLEQPTAALTDAGWLCVLLAALTATWWAAGRNALYLEDNYQEGWRFLVPFWYAVRLIGMFLIAAVDLWLIAAILTILS